MSQRKLRIGFVTNNPVGGKTGLARNAKAILPILYNTNKYELFFLSQGMPDNAAEYLKLPFKCEGVFKNLDQQRFQQDQNYQRYCAYGNCAIEEFVTKNKLDCLVLSDDIWAFTNDSYLNTDWFKYMQKNILPVITADSIPLLPQIKEWAEKCENMRFWSSFPKRVLEEENKEKYKHCDFIYGGIKTEDFIPISKKEKLELRKKFNIAEDEKIIMYLGRNQLRKIYASHMEGLAKFRKKYPEKKLRLLFHCSWSEQMGWPLNQIREQYGLKKEDVLTTYYCKSCSDWHIQPFEGEDIQCNACGQKQKITAGVGSSINEKDLNKIYNIADGSASIFTSGSFEFTNPESMLAGVPLAVPNYVCGEDFLNSGFVYEIKGTHTWESNSGFWKFVPDTDSVCDFFNYIYELPEEKRRQIVDNGRRWAVEKFDANNIAKIYEKFFDSLTPIDWDIFLNKKKELKNINAQVEDKQNDDDFVMECYSKILAMNPPSGDEGRLYWNSFLKQPRDKGQLKGEIVMAMRNAGVVHNNKVQPNSFENLLDKNDKSRVLLALKESLGDLYMITSLLPEIQNKYPDATIYIGCDPKYWDVFDGLSVKLLPWMPEFDNELWVCGQAGHKGFFNHYINVGISTQKMLNYLSNKYTKDFGIKNTSGDFFGVI